VSLAPDLTPITVAVTDIPRRSQWRVVLRNAARTRQGALGLGLTGLIVVIAVVGPFVAPYSADSFVAIPFAGPSASHWLGGDTLGRDVLSRVLAGGWVLLVMGVAATVVGVGLGAAAGVSAAYLRGRTDSLIMRSVDILLAFPQLVFILMLLSIIGPKTWLIVLSVGITNAPGVARVLRSAALDVSERDYIKQVELQGVKPLKVMRSEILPNLTSPLMVEVGVRFTFSITLTAALSFIGFGLPPPAPNWGYMINENRLGLASNPWAVVVPTILLALLAVGANTFTDAIAHAAIGLDQRPDESRKGQGSSETAASERATLAGPEAEAEPVVSRLEVHDLTIALSGKKGHVVEDVSFTVEAGKLLGIVGESGSGKTTVALALLGRTRRGLSVARGSVLLDGTDILRLDAGQLRETRGAKVAYVPQDPSAALNPTLKVGTQLREALSVHPGVAGNIDQRIREVLTETRLDARKDVLDRYPHQLSGGEQQRVVLAMAFACRPALIVLDEPTTGLDVSTQRHVLETVRRLCSAYGVAAVYVSHDLAVVGDLVSKVAVMYAGRIIEYGATSAIFGSPMHPYTRGLLASVPSPERVERLAGIEGQPPRPGHRPEGCSFAPRCSYAVGECRETAPVPLVIGRRMVECLRAREIAGDSQERVLPGPVTVVSTGGQLVARGVSAYYGRRRVLQGIDLELGGNGCVAIVGESGSGKTTFAKCVVGLHSDWTGTMSLEGRQLEAECRARPRDALRTIQYIGQNPYTSLNPRKTIRQILTQPMEHFFALPEAERNSRAVTALHDVALADHILDRYPGQLSGGERQRIAIARALVVDPEILVCDEITSALDVSVQAVIVELLRRLQSERQLALIFITHNLALVRSIAQSALVFRMGEVVEAGPTDQILGNPQNPYTIALIRDIPVLPASHPPANRDHGALRPG